MRICRMARVVILLGQAVKIRPQYFCSIRDTLSFMPCTYVDSYFVQSDLYHRVDSQRYNEP